MDVPREPAPHGWTWWTSVDEVHREVHPKQAVPFQEVMSFRWTWWTFPASARPTSDRWLATTEGQGHASATVLGSRPGPPGPLRIQPSERSGLATVDLVSPEVHRSAGPGDLETDGARSRRPRPHVL